MTAPHRRFDTSVNYYQILDVPFGATPEEITRAYRQLIRLTHPDTFREPADRAKAEERTKLINAAYAVLSRPETRSAYDSAVRHTVMAEALMQRYTGNAPGRPSPLRDSPRPPAARVVRAQREAYHSAIRQLVLATGGIVVGLIAIVVILALAAQGFKTIF